MLPKHSLFIDLLQMKRIQSVSQLQVELRYQQEMNSLSRLCQQKSSYLNRYDQLFRYITLWLLQHGYDLTDYQPHQTLKAVCLSHFPNWDIEEVVRQRHLLKRFKAESRIRCRSGAATLCEYFSSIPASL